jgi:hypothetical protein
MVEFVSRARRLPGFTKKVSTPTTPERFSDTRAKAAIPSLGLSEVICATSGFSVELVAR